MVADWQAASPEVRSLGITLLNQLLCLEEAPQVEDLPCGQADETAHGEYAEVQHTCVGGLWREVKQDSQLCYCSVTTSQYYEQTNKMFTLISVGSVVNSISVNCCFHTIGVPHLFLSLLHVSKVIDNRLRQVLQSPQLDLKGLQLLHLGNLEGQNSYGKWSAFL